MSQYHTMLHKYGKRVRDFFELGVFIFVLV